MKSFAFCGKPNQTHDFIALLAGAVEYTDSTSTEEKDHLTSDLDIILNSLMVRL